MGESAENTAKSAKPVKKDKAKKTSFFKSLKIEFKKITWPDRRSTFRQSVAVVAISVVVGVIIAILDRMLQYGVNIITSL